MMQAPYFSLLGVSVEFSVYGGLWDWRFQGAARRLSNLDGTGMVWPFTLIRSISCRRAPWHHQVFARPAKGRRGSYHIVAGAALRLPRPRQAPFRQRGQDALPLKGLTAVLHVLSDSIIAGGDGAEPDAEPACAPAIGSVQERPSTPQNHSSSTLKAGDIQ
jgi:hypothetical protein